MTLEDLSERDPGQSTHSVLADSLTMVLPTRNRPDLLRRCLGYYAAMDFPARIIVADSSEPDLVLTADEIGSLEGLRLEYRVLPSETPYAEKLSGALAEVGTLLTVLAADDDFFTLTGLTRAAEFLCKHTEYSAAHGSAVTFTVIQDPVGQTPTIVTGEYPQTELCQPRAADRMRAHFERYAPNWYSVQRTVALRQRWRITCEQGFGLHFTELVPSGLAVVQGRVKRVSGLYMARQADTAKEYDPLGMREWVDTPQWPEEYARFRDCIASSLSAMDELSLLAAGRQVDAAFRVYLERHVPSPLPSPIPARRALSAAWSTVLRSPLAAGLAARLPGRRSRGGTEWSVTSLREASSPHYHDFRPIFHAITAATASGSTKRPGCCALPHTPGDSC